MAIHDPPMPLNFSTQSITRSGCWNAMIILPPGSKSLQLLSLNTGVSVRNVEFEFMLSTVKLRGRKWGMLMVRKLDR